MQCLLASVLITIFAAFSCNALPLDNEISNGFDLSYLGKSVFGKPNNATGRRVHEWKEDSDINAEELGDYLEGDILFPVNSRNGLIAETSRWSDGVIPYEISGYFSQKDLNTISDAMDSYHKNTCIRFKPKISNDVDYISITSGNTGCWSSVGKIGGRQEVNLQSPGCLTKIGTPIHELMHAVGFMHEQNRFERDKSVDIVWGNILKGRDNNFQKAAKGTTTGYGVNYDFKSVMHYSDKAFSQNGRATIVPKVNNVKMGQREGFSSGDIEKIRKMYGCHERDTGTSTTNGGGIFSLLFGK